MISRIKKRKKKNARGMPRISKKHNELRLASQFQEGFHKIKGGDAYLNWARARGDRFPYLQEISTRKVIAGKGKIGGLILTLTRAKSAGTLGEQSRSPTKEIKQNVS